MKLKIVVKHLLFILKGPSLGDNELFWTCWQRQAKSITYIALWAKQASNCGKFHRSHEITSCTHFFNNPPATSTALIAAASTGTLMAFPIIAPRFVLGIPLGQLIFLKPCKSSSSWRVSTDAPWAKRKIWMPPVLEWWLVSLPHALVWTLCQHHSQPLPPKLPCMSLKPTWNSSSLSCSSTDDPQEKLSEDAGTLRAQASCWSSGWDFLAKAFSTRKHSGAHPRCRLVLCAAQVRMTTSWAPKVFRR